jgi:hypothetical protein
VNTVRSRLFRARMALKERLDPQFKRCEQTAGVSLLGPQIKGEEE